MDRVIEIKDGERTIDPGLDGVWLRVKNINVHIHETDEGVVVDLWAADDMMADGPVASTYAFFAECEVDNDD